MVHVSCVLGIYIFYLFYPSILMFFYVLSIICTNKELLLNVVVQCTMTINFLFYSFLNDGLSSSGP